MATRLAGELPLGGILLAIAGLGYLLRFRTSQALLFGIGGLLNLFFIMNYDVFDFEVFLLPTVLTSWLCATVVLERIRVRLRSLGRPVHALFLSFIMVWGGWHLQEGYVASDRSDEFGEVRRFDAQLQPRSVVVNDSYLIDSMLRYKLLGENAGGTRDIRAPQPERAKGLRELHEKGFAVFAFPKSVRRLRLQGFRFNDVSLFEPVQRHLAFAPRGTIVGIAAPRGVAHLLAGGEAGSTVGNLGEAFRPAWGLVGVVGTNGQALEQWASEGVQLEVRAGDEIGTTGVAAPTAFQVRAGSENAAILRGGQIVRSSRGSVLIVELEPDGTLRESHAVNADTSLGIEVDQKDLVLHRLLDPGVCQEVEATAWTDVSELASAGKVAVRIPNGATLQMYIGRDTALRPRLIGVDEATRLELETRSFSSSHDSRADLRRAFEEDGVPSGTIVGERPQIYRLTLEDTVTQRAVDGGALVFGGVPRFALAKQGAKQGGTVSMCSATLGYDGLFRNSTDRVERLTWQRRGEYELLGSGWRQDEAENLRWVTDAAELLLPFWQIGDLRVSVEASTPDWIRDGELGTVGLRMNGQEFSRQPVSRGFAVYEWDIPDAALRDGLNQAYLTVSPPHNHQSSESEPMLGIGVRTVRLSLD